MSNRPESLPFFHVVAAIIWRPDSNNYFLISKRQKGKHLEHFWELPGGKLETGESRIDGLRRELKEEVDILCKDSSPFMQVRHDYEDRSILLDVWEVNSFEGEVKAREDQQVRWIKIENLSKYRFPEADKPVIEAIAHSAKAKMVHPP